jgi:hypothetical protein
VRSHLKNQTKTTILKYKTMKKIITILVLFVGFSMTVQAQNNMMKKETMMKKDIKNRFFRAN